MKSSILVCKLENGTLHSAAFPIFSQAENALGSIRKAGVMEVGKKPIPVEIAIVLTQNAGAAQVVKIANIGADRRRAALVAKAEAEAKAAKAKAEKDLK
jgi:hypothetical protein